MFRVGVVGESSRKVYSPIVNSINSLELVGIFDPSFQFKQPSNVEEHLVYLSFEELLNKSDSIIFASSENIYVPLIEMAIKHSKFVFLHSLHNVLYKEQLQLLKLKDEAGTLLQVQHPIVHSQIFKKQLSLSKKPLLLSYDYSDSSEGNLLYRTRLVIGAILSIIKSNIRKTTINTISTFSDVADVIKIRLDFDNGSVADVTISSISKESKHFINSYEHNSYLETDLIENTISGKVDGENVFIQADSEIFNDNIKAQLIDFYTKIASQSSPVNYFNNEIITQKIIDKIKDKLRIYANIY